MQYELYHHGILGMKWGIRRFQNKDGTLTSAGRERYGVKDTDKTFVLESGHEKLAFDMAHDEKLQKQIKTAIQSDKALLDSAKAYKDATDALMNASKSFSKKWSKEHKGKEWSGDGTEFHWELEKRYPEYKNISRNEQHALRVLVDNATRFAKSSNIAAAKDSPYYFISGKGKEAEYYYKGNAFAAAVADISTDGYAPTFLNSYRFIEYYKKNKKGVFERAKSWRDEYDD